MPERLPVLIVGAGPTGLTAALELSRMGVPVRIVDKVAQFSTTSRALAVQARTLELFAQRGLTDDMLHLGNVARGTAIYGDGKLLGKIDLRLVPSPFNMILLLAQSETERLQREQLMRQGVTIELETELIAIGQSGEGAMHDALVRAVLRKADGTLEAVEAAYLVATEGAHSSIRHTLNLEFKGKSLPHAYALADLHADGPLPEDELTVFLSERGLLASFPMGSRRFRVIASLHADGQHAKSEGYAPHAEPSVEQMQQLWDAGASIPAQLHDMVWSSSFRINSRMVDRLRVGRVFFGGDAAHVHSPAGGQGMNTGIQDMINLAWKLAMVYKGVAKPELLDTYEQERLPLIHSVVSKTEGATDLLDTESSWTHMLLTHAAPLALGSDMVKRKSASILSQVEGNYEKSALSAHSGRLGELRPGDRLPPDIFAVAGESRTLLEAMGPDHFTLLYLNGMTDEDLRAVVPEHIQTLSVVTKPTRSPSEDPYAILVRPDGYIAWIGKRAEGDKLTAWHQAWFMTPTA